MQRRLVRIVINFVIILLNCLSNNVVSQNVSQDTSAITLPELEKHFLLNNLLLLAEKYNIDEAKAQTLQAKLWDNPNLSYEVNPYNQYTKKFMDYSSNGESLVEINQLFYLAGKRNKKISLAKISADIAENQFYDLLRALKYQLRTSFYNLYFFEQTAKLFDKEINSYQKLIDQNEIQYQKGNISLKENTRLKAELFALKNEELTVLDSVNTNQSVLKLLMNDTTKNYIIPVLDTNLFSNNNIKRYTVADLQKSAIDNRYDLKSYESQVKWNEANFSLQKSLAVPDIIIHADYDHQNNYIKDYYGLGFSIDLPVFNRNQGNIKSSEAQIKQSNLQYQGFYSQLNNDVLLVYSRTMEAQNLSNKMDTQFTSDLKKIIDGILTSYENRSISMLEFIDYYESYKQTLIQTNQLKNDLLNHYEEINYVTGADLFNK
jgi:cobalt-zinc-cadmium efflux system outer membrane protein